MPPQIATLVFIVGILGLFLLDRDREVRTYKGLWIPVLWLLINGSRPVSAWLQAPGTPTKAADPNQLLEGSPFDRNIYTAVLIAGLIVLISRRRQIGTLLRSNAPIILFFSYCAISILWSDFPDVAFKRWNKGMGDLAMVLIVLTDIDVFAALRRLLTRTGFVLVPLSVLFIKYLPDLGRTYNRWTWTWTAVGVTGNKNELGMVCLVIGLGTVWRILLWLRSAKGTRRKGPLIAQVTLLAMILYLLGQSTSMTSLSCFLLGSGLIAATNTRAIVRKPSVVHLLVAAAVSLPLFALFLDPGGSLIQGLGKDPTLTGRTDIWRGLIAMAANPLFGAGYESFWLGDRLQSSRSLMWRLNEAHNGYLEVWLNLGWIGVSLLALVIVKGYRKVVAVLPQDPDMGSIMLAYFSVGVIYSLTEAGFRMTSINWIFFLLATTAVPAAAALKGASVLGVDNSDRMAEGESQPECVQGVGHRGGTFEAL